MKLSDDHSPVVSHHPTIQIKQSTLPPKTISTKSKETIKLPYCSLNTMFNTYFTTLIAISFKVHARVDNGFDAIRCKIFCHCGPTQQTNAHYNSFPIISNGCGEKRKHNFHQHKSNKMKPKICYLLLESPCPFVCLLVRFFLLLTHTIV